MQVDFIQEVFPAKFSMHFLSLLTTLRTGAITIMREGVTFVVYCCADKLI
jgi:hypothetical protein